MSTNRDAGGARPPKSSPPQRPPATRQERREAARRDQRLAAARTASAARKPAWQSPMALITAGAVVIGLIVVILASGVLSQKATVGTLIKPLRPASASLVDPTNPRVLGKASAPVTVDVWSDFQCPACDAFATTVEPDLIDQYVATGKVRLVYRDFAFIDKGAATGESHQAAAAARCVGDRFWAFHDYLFENQNPKGENLGTFSAAFLASVADAVGASRTSYDACMANGAADAVAAVNAETAQGQAAGVNQTPTLALNGKLLQGGALPMSTLGPAIDALIASGSPVPGGSPSASPSPAATAAP